MSGKLGDVAIALTNMLHYGMLCFTSPRIMLGNGWIPSDDSRQYSSMMMQSLKMRGVYIA